MYIYVYKISYIFYAYGICLRKKKIALLIMMPATYKMMDCIELDPPRICSNEFQ